NRRSDFPEAKLLEIVAHYLIDTVARAQRLLHLGAAEIDVAIFQSPLFVHRFGLVRDERRRRRDAQHFHLPRADLDIAGGQLRIVHARAAIFDFTFDADDPFAAELPRLVMHRLPAGIGIEDHLRD